MDIMTPEQRSKNRSAIKSAGTQPEIRFQKALWHLGYRYRKNNRTVFGKPDITFKKQRLAIFIDSEFFHGKDWQTKKRPQTNGIIIKAWGGNVKIKLEICNLRTRDDPYRTFEIHVT